MKIHFLLDTEERKDDVRMSGSNKVDDSLVFNIFIRLFTFLCEKPNHNSNKEKEKINKIK